MPRLAAVAVLLLAARLAGAEALADDDRRALEGLVPRPLIDPQGSTWVRVTAPMRTVWCETVQVVRCGWMPAHGAGEPARVRFADGEEAPPIPADQPQPKPLDFVAACEDWLAQEEQAREHDAFKRLEASAAGLPADPPAVVAAWLHRLGHDDLAARALAVARQPAHLQGRADPFVAARHDLAWRAYAGLIHAYMVRADDEALAHGRRLLALYPDLAPANAEPVVAEIERRQRERHDLEKLDWEPPPDWAARDSTAQIAFLIAALDEVDVRQLGQPWHIDPTVDRRVNALIEIGDAAVPALIDTLDHDVRLTRAVQFWRDFSPERRVISVREAALAALIGILRVPVFPAEATSEDSTVGSDETAHRLAGIAHAYWTTHGDQPVERRLLAALIDPAASRESRRTIATELSLIDRPETLAMRGIPCKRRGPREQARHQAVLALSGPSAAEAVLAAAEADLTAATASDHPEEILTVYHDALVQLGDRRIAAAVARHADAESVLALQIQWIDAAAHLGETAPLERLARGFADGTLAAPTAGERSTQVVRAACVLARARLPFAHEALMRVVDARHRDHDLFVSALTSAEDAEIAGARCDPFCVALLRSALADRFATGVAWTYDGERIVERHGDTIATWGISEELEAEAKAGHLRDTVVEHRSERAALLLSRLVYGLPFCHPLLIDDERRRTQLAERLDRWMPAIRALTPAERRGLIPSVRTAMFIIAPPTLDRPATDADVATGRALFSLGPGAKHAEATLPATATWTMPGKTPIRLQVLVVQAEDDAAGRRHYAVVARDRLATIAGDELSALDALPPAPRSDE